MRDRVERRGGGGMSVLGLKERPEDLSARQACAAIGQTKLMQSYATHFATHGLNVAQLLLTYGDLDSRIAHQNVRNTLARIFERRTVVPIINENDSVAVEELRFGDNDKLSAEVAVLVEADMLIILTSVDGLLDKKPARSCGGEGHGPRGRLRAQRRRASFPSAGWSRNSRR